MNNQKALIEGLIFLAGEDGLTITQIQHALSQEDIASIYKDIKTLKKEYAQTDRGIELVEYANRFKFVTK